jgi:hypothetical protein
MLSHGGGVGQKRAGSQYETSQTWLTTTIERRHKKNEKGRVNFAHGIHKVIIQGKQASKSKGR